MPSNTNLNHGSNFYGGEKIEAPTRKKQITAHPFYPIHPLLPSPFPPNGLLQHQRSSPAS